MKTKEIKSPNKWMKGKTIQKVDSTCVNCTVFYFTDRTVLMMETIAVAPGIYGPIFTEEPLSV